MNKVILKGRLAKDIELKVTTSGKSVATCSIAVNRRFKQEGQPDADFINLVIWGKTAEVMQQYLGKGREVMIEGRIQVRNYDDSNGNKRYVTEVIVENFEFCGSKPEGQSSYGQQSEFGTVTGMEDIPF